MSHSLKRSLNKQDKTLIDAIKGTVIEKNIRNLKQNVMLSSPAETSLKDTEAQVELNRAPTIVITAVKDKYIKVDLIYNKMGYEIAALQSLWNRWLEVAERYRRQREGLKKNLKACKFRNKALESLIEKKDDKYKELVFCDLDLPNFIHEQRIKVGRVLGISRIKTAVVGLASIHEDSKRWRKCLQPGCTLRESRKNNNMACSFRRVHPKVKYKPSCCEKYN